jgi:hypothetical protein
MIATLDYAKIEPEVIILERVIMNVQEIIQYMLRLFNNCKQNLKRVSNCLEVT